MRFATLLPLLLVACVTPLRTPSGRPELRVSCQPAEAKARLVNFCSSDGWMVTASDDSGVTVSKPLDASATLWIGQGQAVVRFNLLPEGGGTQIRANCMIYSGNGPQDVSGARLGHDAQRVMEDLFAHERLNGPFETGKTGDG